MTKLTINVDGKKYGWADRDTEMDGYWMSNDTINELIRVGVLVELQPQEEKTEGAEKKDFYLKAIKETQNKPSCNCLDRDEQSILQKLRAELEREAEIAKDSTSEYIRGRYWEIQTVLKLLNELEKPVISKEENTDTQETQTLQPEISNEWAREAGKDFAKRHLSQPEPIVPEFDYDEMFNKGGHPNTQCFKIGKQVEAITQYLRENK